MRSLLDLLLKYYFVILFLVLLSFSFFLLLEHSRYHNAVLNSRAHAVKAKANTHFSSVREYSLLRQTNQQLLNENSILRTELDHLRQFAEQAEIDSLGLLTDQNFSYVPAQVSGISVNKQYNRIILDKGRRDGLEPDMAVIAPEGVVGMITDVSEHFSLVMPVINRQFSLSVKIAKNHYFGALAWEGLSETLASLNEIPNHVNVQTGDTIITSGFSLIFPEGIPVGEVIQVNEAEGNFHQIRLNLFVDFRRLTSVYVVNNEMYEEQIDLLNNEEE